jgi:multicomponent Na+:H+ antiporter subunit E
VRRVLALAIWGFLTWVVLTWTLTLEQQVFGAAFAVIIALALSPMGEVMAPWSVLAPRRALALLALLARATRRVVEANAKLAYRIWAPSRPLASGMVLVPTVERTDGGLTAVALVTSVIVDNQVVDVDRRRHVLQYHAVTVPEGDADQVRAQINGPVEDLLAAVEGRDD